MPQAAIWMTVASKEDVALRSARPGCASWTGDKSPLHLSGLCDFGASARIHCKNCASQVFPRINFLMKFFRSNTLSRAHLFMPISRILFFLSSLAITRADLPYSVAATPKCRYRRLLPICDPFPFRYSEFSGDDASAFQETAVSALHSVTSGARLLASGCSWYSIKSRANCEGKTTLCAISVFSLQFTILYFLPS